MTSAIAKTVILLGTLVPASMFAQTAISDPLAIEVATAEQANDQLDTGQATTLTEAEKEKILWEADFSHWQKVQEHDTVQEYEYYLRAFPEGEFVDIAISRIKVLKAERNADTQARLQRIQRASEVDEAAFITKSEALEVEARLSAIGYNVGRVDGDFRQDTREAINAWQESNGLPNNGYLNWTQYQLLCSDTEAQFRKWREDNPSVQISEAQP